MRYHKNNRAVAARRSTRVPIIGGIIAVLTLYIGTTLLWPLQMQIAGSPLEITSKTSAVELPWPTNGRAAIQAEGYGELGRSGDDSSVSIASITKTITALTILQERPLKADQAGPTITFDAADVEIYNHYLSIDGSTAPVSDGFSLSQYDAMRTMLLPSANNYADSLSVWAYGSMDEYLDAASKFLADNGLTSTRVVDASGFSEDSRSNLTDLLKIGKLVMDHPVLSKIVGQKTTEVPGMGTLNNTNFMLGTLGVTGIKTGTTDEAGNCLLFASSYVRGSQTIPMIGVVLGADGFWELRDGVTALLETSQQAFADTLLLAKDEPVATYTAPWGAQTQAVATDDFTIVTWPSTATSATITPLNITPRTGTDVAVGRAGFGESAIDLTLTEPIAGPSPIWRILHPGQVFAR